MTTEAYFSNHEEEEEDDSDTVEIEEAEDYVTISGLLGEGKTEQGIPQAGILATTHLTVIYQHNQSDIFLKRVGKDIEFSCGELIQTTVVSELPATKIDLTVISAQQNSTLAVNSSVCGLSDERKDIPVTTTCEAYFSRSTDDMHLFFSHKGRFSAIIRDMRIN